MPSKLLWFMICLTKLNVSIIDRRAIECTRTAPLSGIESELGDASERETGLTDKPHDN